MLPRLRAVFEPPSGMGRMVLSSYRSVFHSLIKGAIQRHSSDLYRHYFSTDHPIIKPYTFAILFSKARANAEQDIIKFQRATFLFSTISHEWLVALTNALHALQTSHLITSHGPLLLRGMRIEPQQAIQTNAVTFRTLSPVLIRSAQNPRHYLLPRCTNFPGDDAFVASLMENLRQVTNALSNDQEFLTDEVNDLVFKPINLQRTIIKYQKNATIIKMPAFRGTFRLFAAPSLLNFIANVGLGSRRSQGFGMVEHIAQH